MMMKSIKLKMELYSIFKTTSKIEDQRYWLFFNLLSKDSVVYEMVWKNILS